MDLNVLAQMKAAAGDNPAKGVFEGIMKMHGVLRKIELAGMDFKTKKGGKPVAAVLRDGNGDRSGTPHVHAPHLCRK